MYRISKRFEFSAAHALEGLPPEHQCSRYHGHNYVVEVALESAKLTKTGFVRDYGELARFKQWIDSTLDHRWLGYGSITRFGRVERTEDMMRPALQFNPTAENMAKYFFEYCAILWPEVSAVGVSETPKTWAWYSPQNLTLEVLEGAIDTLPEPLRVNFKTAIRDGMEDVK